MDRIKTRDGSETFFSEKYKEHYHSLSGALEEAFEKFVKPCRIAELSKMGNLKILDVCFGLGYNSIAAIEAALDENPNTEIEIVALEKDASVIREAASLTPALKYFPILKKLEHDPITNYLSYEDKNIMLKIKIGNAEQTIKTINQKFDAVFLDPFSLRKNPELWQTGFLSQVRQRMTPEGILATYSCARKVRENLREAGFMISDGPIVGRRGPGTIARPKPI